MTATPDDRFTWEEPPEISPDDARALVEYDELLAALDAVLGRGGNEGDPNGTRPLVAGELERDMAFLRTLHNCWAPSEPASRPAADATAPAGEDDAPLGGRPLGRFQILREIGRGGSGIVLLAHDPVLRRDVALKIPRPEALFTPALRRRLVREGTAAAQLNHPGIIPVYEAGEAGVVCYIATAYCPGPTLAEWLAARRNPVAPEQAATLVATLADAVHYAHTRGVLHRDIKPGNVLCDPLVPAATPEPDEPEPPTNHLSAAPDWIPRLTDFGLARVASSESRLTHHSAILGTPRYMAPEQARGNQSAVGPATDVYALGAVLYELLAGRPPFGGDSELETLRQVIDDEPPRLARARPDVPPDLEAIVLRTLEKDPSRRYASACDLADDLRRYLSGEPTRARPLHAAARAARWCRKRPTVAALGTALAASLVVGLLAVTWQWRRAEASLGVAQRERARAEAQLRTEDELVADLFRLSRDSGRMEERLELRMNLRDRLIERCRQEIAASTDPREVASAYSKYAILTTKATPAEAEALAEKACRIWDRIARQQPHDTEVELAGARAYVTSAMLAFDSQHHEEAARRLTLARQFYDQHPESVVECEYDWRRLAETHSYAGHVFNRNRKPEIALALYRGALDVHERLVKVSRSRYVVRLMAAHRDVADINLQLGDADAAARHLDAARQLLASVEAEVTSDERPLPRIQGALAEMYTLLGRMLLGRGRRDEGMQAFDRAIAEADAFLQTTPTDSKVRFQKARTLHQRAGCYDDLRQPRGAIADYEQAAELCHALTRDEPYRREYAFELAKNYHWIGRLNAEIGQRQPAFKAFQQAEDVLLAAAPLAELPSEQLTYLARVYLYAARLEKRGGSAETVRQRYAKAEACLLQLLEKAPHEEGFRKDLVECQAQRSAG